MDLSSLQSLVAAGAAVSTDSRNIPSGCVFVALHGEKFDGNRFAAAALASGAAAAVVDDAAAATDPRCLLVADTLTAYKELARWHRRRFHIPVIGITGTNGKTTTKELIAAVLAKKYRVMATEGNYNNDVGVPRTLLRLCAGDEIAVVEMGASHPGDIRRLVEYVEPTCGLITNVGVAHIQGFGSFEGVKRTKGELYDWLAAHGATAFVNAASVDLAAMAAERALPDIIWYAHAGQAAAVRGRVVACAPALTFAWQADGAEHTVPTRLIGAYNIDNMLAAVAIGRHFGVADADICAALADYEPRLGRSQLVRTARNTLIVDAYNANPSSMAAALDNFELVAAEPKMLILGDMAELGTASEAEHLKVVRRLAAHPAWRVWLVGACFGKAVAALAEATTATEAATNIRAFATAADVRAALAAECPDGACVLVKGSHSIGLQSVAEAL